jgi:CHAD domain-containing protein
MELDYVKLKDIKPALSRYISDARLMLKSAPLPGDRVIHDTRVLMKKARAVSRLIINQVDEELFRRNYCAFREVGRATRSWRETSVYRKTLKELKKSYPRLFSILVEDARIKDLTRKNDEVASGMEAEGTIKEDLEKIDELLGKAGYRIRFQDMSGLDARLLAERLDATFYTVTDRYLACRNNPKPSNLHEFRKRSKDFLYQLYFFRPLNPPVIKDLEKRLDSMTRYLGKYNDLAQLMKYLGYKYPDPDNTSAINELAILIRERQDSCLSKVWPLAYRIFCPGQRLANILGFRILTI